MKKKHRVILSKLMQLCNDLGGSLDGTSTHESKYRDRQKAHSYTFRILLAVLSDHPENECSKDEWDDAEVAIKELEALKAKQYPDRKGLYE